MIILFKRWKSGLACEAFFKVEMARSGWESRKVICVLHYLCITGCLRRRIDRKLHGRYLTMTWRDNVWVAWKLQQSVYGDIRCIYFFTRLQLLPRDNGRISLELFTFLPDFETIRSLHLLKLSLDWFDVLLDERVWRTSQHPHRPSALWSDHQEWSSRSKYCDFVTCLDKCPVKFTMLISCEFRSDSTISSASSGLFSWPSPSHFTP